jgi:Fe-S cluster biogenesis protein NfuA
VAQEPSLDQLLEMYDDGLHRVWAVLSDEQRAALADDPAVASVLLMHDLYPVSLQDRVQEALDSVRPYMDSHGGNIELVALEDGVAHLKLEGSCHGCGASQTTMELAIEEALQAVAPDLLGLEVDGVVERPATARPVASSEAEWVAVPGAAELGRFETLLAGGLLVANVAGTLLAYRDTCACGAHLAAATLDGGRLRCAGCARSFDLPRAGRCVEDAAVQLTPVPLLRRDGEVRVAVEHREERPTCELCPSGIGEHHRHLLHLGERRILCVCETCWSVRSGDPEFRPPGARTVWLDDVAIPDHVWAAFQIPIGLAFMIRSSVSGGIVALYPSPAGATESELDLAAWDELVALHPELDRLEPDAEALVVNRMTSPAQHAIVPVDQAYRLVGLVKERWTGISGGSELEAAVAGFFDDIRGEAVAA